MAFWRGPVRAPSPVRARVSVFAVGSRVYVAACASDRSVRATLTDNAGRPLASLSDGTELAIVAWLPGWAGATRYRVRVTESRLEGWLPVGNLRSTQVATSSPVTVPPPPAVPPSPDRVEEIAESPRRFGQRS